MPPHGISKAYNKGTEAVCLIDEMADMVSDDHGTSTRLARSCWAGAVANRKWPSLPITSQPKHLSLTTGGVSPAGMPISIHDVQTHCQDNVLLVPMVYFCVLEEPHSVSVNYVSFVSCDDVVDVLYYMWTRRHGSFSEFLHNSARLLQLARLLAESLRKFHFGQEEILGVPASEDHGNGADENFAWPLGCGKWNNIET